MDLDHDDLAGVLDLFGGLPRDELERLCTALRRDYQRNREKGWTQEGEVVWRIPIFWVAFYTGMRGSELARLRWKDVDFERRLIYIRKQKNNKENGSVKKPVNGTSTLVIS